MKLFHLLSKYFNYCINGLTSYHNRFHNVNYCFRINSKRMIIESKQQTCNNQNKEKKIVALDSGFSLDRVICFRWQVSESAHQSKHITRTLNLRLRLNLLGRDGAGRKKSTRPTWLWPTLNIQLARYVHTTAVSTIKQNALLFLIPFFK